MKEKHIRKADEMEMSINFKAVRCAWIFLEMGLLIFSVVYLIISGGISLVSSVPFVMAMLSSFVFWIVKLYYTKRMTKAETSDDEE